MNKNRNWNKNRNRNKKKKNNENEGNNCRKQSKLKVLLGRFGQQYLRIRANTIKETGEYDQTSTIPHI